LEQVPAEVMQVFFVVNIYTKKVTFQSVQNSYCRIIDHIGNELARYHLQEGGHESGLIIARLFREPSKRWAFQALGRFSRGTIWKDTVPDIQAILKMAPREYQEKSTPSGYQKKTVPHGLDATSQGTPQVSKTNRWHTFFIALAVLNTSLYVGLARLPPDPLGNDAYHNIARILAFPYVFQTSWRCIFISEYPNRRTIFDHPLNSVLLARLMAAVGEVCFGAQLALGLFVVCSPASVLPYTWVLYLAICMVIFDGIGQCCATYGTIMGSHFPFFVEGLLWTSIFFIALLLACTSILATPLYNYDINALFLWMVLALTLPGITYLIFGYCPLCWDAWKKAAPAVPSTFSAKFWEALTYRSPTHDWNVWQHEVTWQTLYFSIGTWSSLGLMAIPLR
jgi:hypothetical protein